MKKIVYILLLVVIGFISFGCDNGGKENYTKSNIIISKYYSTSDLDNTAIELYNLSQKDIDLSEWMIEIYSNGESIVSYQIELSGTIKAQDYFVIARSMVTDEILKEKADLENNDLLFNGDDVIVLKQGDKTQDIIGDIGGTVEFGKFVTLIRKPAYMKARSKYQPYDFIMYLEGMFQYLKNEDFPVKTDEELNKGPILLDEYRELPFVSESDSNLGGGGVIEVNLLSVADGDTATFETKDDSRPFLDSAGQYTKQVKLRFTLIDTKENSPGGVGVEEWGQPASVFMKHLLNQAKSRGAKIEIQSVLNGGLRDTYLRYLGYVWIDGYLANFMVVRAGLSDVRSQDLTTEARAFHYLNVPYVGYCENAYVRAKNNGWGIHGEKDLMWDYANSKPIPNALPQLPDPRE